MIKRYTAFLIEYIKRKHKHTRTHKLTRIYKRNGFESNKYLKNAFRSTWFTYAEAEEKERKRNLSRLVQANHSTTKEALNRTTNHFLLLLLRFSPLVISFRVASDSIYVLFRATIIYWFFFSFVSNCSVNKVTRFGKAVKTKESRHLNSPNKWSMSRGIENNVKISLPLY